MTSTIAIRSFAPDEWRLYRTLRLAALADSPDAFASTLAGEQAMSDEEWTRRLTKPPGSPASCSIVAETGDRVVGLAYSQISPEDPGRADLYSMWVEPAARRMGTGRCLVETIVSWARDAQARELNLDVTAGNLPALRLYQGFGFVLTGETSPLRTGSALRVETMRLEL